MKKKKITKKERRAIEEEMEVLEYLNYVTFFPMEYLVEKTGLNKRTVRRVLNKCDKQGMIRKRKETYAYKNPVTF